MKSAKESGVWKPPEWDPVTKSHAFHQVSVRRRTYWQLVVVRRSARPPVHVCVCVGVCAVHARASERKTGNVHVRAAFLRARRRVAVALLRPVPSARHSFSGRWPSSCATRRSSEDTKLAVGRNREQQPPPFSPSP